MSTTLGSITVPLPSISGTAFPLSIDYPFVSTVDPKVAVHQFGSYDGKIEQRFMLGVGSTDFQVRRLRISEATETSLKNFWIANNGASGIFPFQAPNQDGSTTTILCRFKSDTLSLDGVQAAIKSLSGLVLTQVPNYTYSGGTWNWAPPTYSVTNVLTRFPDDTLTPALLQQNQTLFPLIMIQPLDPSYPAIYVSDRDVILNGSGYSNQLFQARIVKWSGVQQYMVGGPTSSSSGGDQATFVLGNADRILSALKNSVDLRLAHIEFSVFHADTGIKLDFWAGQIESWEMGIGDPNFTLYATDGFSELASSYPPRTVVRTCWKLYAGGAGQPCTWTSGTGLDTTDYPSADSTQCDKGFSTANGCLAHNNGAQWGGIDAQPQGVTVLINNTGFMGFARQSITSFSVISDTAFNQPLPEIWCDVTSFLSDASQGMPINPIMMAYRDESDFADSLSIIGSGPITEFSQADGNYASHFMDSIPYQGWNADNSKLNNLGLRLCFGNDPTSDLFAMGQSSNGAPSTYAGDNQLCAGTSFAEVRIKKDSTFVPSTPDSHQVLVTLRRGITGYSWAGAGTRLAQSATLNPVWVAVNAALRTKGYFSAGDALQEDIFDANDATAAGAICDLSVTPVIGTGTENQFTYNGIISDRRALRDWLEDIMACCCGFYWIKFGKLSFGIRDNASAVEAFNTSNIIWNSLKLRSANIGFNILTANFGDVEFNFQKNSVMYWDEDFAKYWGGNPLTPRYLPKELNLSGACTKSQNARIAIIRTREETGGIGTKCVTYHSEGSYDTTILGLNVFPGMVCSMGSSDTMLDLPDYPISDDSVDPAVSNFIKFRVNKLTLNPDYSISVEFRTVHYDMYDMISGPKPVDNPGPMVPVTTTASPDNIIYNLSTDSGGNLTLSGLQIGQYAAIVNRVTWEVYAVDETASGTPAFISGSLSSSATSLTTSGPALAVGYYLVDQEIIYVSSVSGSATIMRACFGTTAADHSAQATSISVINSLWPLDLIVGSGLAVSPGMVAVNSGAIGNSFVSEYVSSSGLVRLSAPLATAPTVTGPFTACSVLYPLNITSQMISVPAGFFVSGDTGNWSVTSQLPCAGVAYSQVKATSTNGNDSDWFGTNFTPVLKTHGGTDFTATFPQLPMGSTANIFQPVLAPQSSDFFGAYCTIANLTGISVQPVQAPVAATVLTPTGLTATGIITLSGTPDPTCQVQVYVALNVILGRTRGRHIYASSWSSNSSLTTLTSMATDLTNWLNADPVFSANYSVTSSGAVVSIYDLNATGGTVGASVSSGSATVFTPSGFTSVLGIYFGRTYAFAYVDATDGYTSDLSNVSAYSPATGSFASDTVSNMSVSTDSRVNFIDIYAYPDGTNSGIPYKLGRIANSSPDGSGFTSYTDTQVESGLTGLTAWAGPVQPSQADDVIVTVNRNGVEWFEMHVPPNSSQSNIVASDAMRGVSQGSQITFNVVNNIGPLDLQVVVR